MQISVMGVGVETVSDYHPQVLGFDTLSTWIFFIFFKWLFLL